MFKKISLLISLLVIASLAFAEINERIGLYENKKDGYNLFFSEKVHNDFPELNPIIIEYEEGWSTLSFIFKTEGERTLGYKGITSISIEIDDNTIFSRSVKNSSADLQNFKWVETAQFQFKDKKAIEMANMLITIANSKKASITISGTKGSRSSIITKPIKDEYKKVGEAFLKYFEV